MKDAEIVTIPVPKELELIPVTYDTNKLLEDIKGMEINYKDENEQVVSFELYKGAIDMVVEKYTNLLLTEENEKEFTETRTFLNKNLAALENVSKDIKKKIKTQLERKLEPLENSIDSLKTLITGTFTKQINEIDTIKRTNKLNGIVEQYLDGYIETNGNALKITKEEIKELYKTKRTDRTTWEQYLSNSGTEKKDIAKAFIELGQRITTQKEKETIKTQKIQINTKKAEELIALVKKERGLDLSISDLDVQITENTTEEDLKASIKRVYNKRNKETPSETPTIKTGSHDLTFSIPDDLINLFTFAVGFRTADEQVEFVTHMRKFPGWDNIFVKDLDTFHLGGKK